MFKRKAYDALVQWKSVSQGATAALLEGARRIGKSTVVEPICLTRLLVMLHA
ncbi:MAG: hypothetical protein HFJ64_06095 [Eggerthellaceae bacterium]|nr:hypothetical protein [Eggerthellaceae bacterium]